MDSYREHPSDFELPSDDASAPYDVAAAIGTDERRMHVRAYNYWVSLLEGRDFPSIEELEPADVSDFATHSVLLDFTCGRDNPAIPYVGAAIRDECGVDDDMRVIADVPSRSLLSRLTDHYMQIIANRAPVGFEAEFENQRSESICYRGILMPFSSDGDTIDFIYGVINWKRVGEGVQDASAGIEMPVVEFADPWPEDVEREAVSAPEPESIVEEPLELTELAEEEDALELTHVVAVSTVPDAFAPVSEAPADVAEAEFEAAPPIHFSWEDGPLGDEDEVPVVELDENAGLADRLWAARETAESVKAGEGRTRAALYKALSLAYDFAIAARQNSEEYVELLEESGVKAQARAPMTPIVKLVFGIDYDKARLTEFAAALAFAQRQEIALGAFQDFIQKYPGGLKALVAAERQARRPQAKPDTKSEIARDRLRSAPPISLADVPAEEEFAVIVTRRGADGTHEPVAIVDDEALVERAIRRVL
ncbi:MAG TPA: hypothetical protein VF776_06340 [Sphingomicrobium sp.]